jgi:hypothetical protein
MKTARAETPAYFILSIVRAYERYGQSPDEALLHAGLSLPNLQRPGARVTAHQMEIFTARAMRDLNDEALGWFSRRLPYGTAGMLCRAALPSADLRIALIRWCRNYGYLQDDIQLDLAVTREYGRIEVKELSDLGWQREFCLVSTLRNIIGYACWLVDSQLPLTDVTFPFAATSAGSAYRYMFQGMTRFGEECTSVTLPIFASRSVEMTPT